MILYVNGDSHSAGAEAINNYCFAEDDPLLWNLGRIPHPDNERVSYGCNIANDLFAVLHCDAESASSNSRIMRTTRKYIRDEGKPDAIIIGWSTWEREEWLHNDIYWQVNAGGIGHDWPDEIKERYKSYIIDLDWTTAEHQAHNDIYNFHTELLDLDIPHLFFNTFNHFNQPHKDWHNNYVEPYNPSMTYYQWLLDHECTPRTGYHFGPDGHRKWAEFLIPHLTNLNIV
jgi:hypothetical protein